MPHAASVVANIARVQMIVRPNLFMLEYGCSCTRRGGGEGGDRRGETRGREEGTRDGGHGVRGGVRMGGAGVTMRSLGVPPRCGSSSVSIKMA
jgi:hypothetical protein